MEEGISDRVFKTLEGSVETSRARLKKLEEQKTVLLQQRLKENGEKRYVFASCVYC